jgi:hypothetical protein
MSKSWQVSLRRAIRFVADVDDLARAEGRQATACLAKKYRKPIVGSRGICRRAGSANLMHQPWDTRSYNRPIDRILAFGQCHHAEAGNDQDEETTAIVRQGLGASQGKK